MKCKVCGYEYDDSRNNCPMCGTPAENADAAAEMKWNTKDFPKPKREVADIQMQWSNPDVSEGYISLPDRPRRQFSQNNEVNLQELKAEPESSEVPTEPAPTPITYSDPDAQRVPRVEAGRLPERFYTFQTKNEEFQQLLDKEFERIRELQSQLPESKRSPLPGSQPAVEIPLADDFDRMLLDDTADSEALPEPEVFKNAQPAAPKVHADAPFDIQTLEDSIRLIREEEEIAQRESEERLRKLEAMKAARDAYFKSLDEAEAKKPMRGLFWRDRDSFRQEPEKPAEQPAEKPVEKPAEKPAEKAPELVMTSVSQPAAEPEKPVVSPQERIIEIPNLEDLTGPLTDNAEHTIQFVKEDFVAAQDARIREERRKAAEEAERRAAEEEEARRQAAIAEAERRAAEEEARRQAAIAEAERRAAEEEEARRQAALAEAERRAAEEEARRQAALAEAERRAAEEEEARRLAAATVILAEEPAAEPEEKSEPELVLPTEEDVEDLKNYAEEILAEEPELPARSVPAPEEPVSEPKADPIATQTFGSFTEESGEETTADASEDDDDEDDEFDDRKGFSFLKFLGLVIAILLLIQVIVFGFEKLLPDAAFTQNISHIASSIQAACDEFMANIIDKISELFH